MQNPFESGHIKNYILLYVSVVVIMILFFIAATLFRDTKVIEEKIFNTTIVEKSNGEAKKKAEQKTQKARFKLLDKAY